MKSYFRPLTFLVLPFAGALAACDEEPLDPAVRGQKAGDDVENVFKITAEAARGTNGAQSAVSRLGTSVEVLARTLEPVPLNPSRAQREPQTVPAEPRRSVWSQVLGGMPGWRATVRPLATKSLLGPEPVKPTAGVVFQTAGSELADDLQDTGQMLRRFLNERILVAQNLETQTDSEAIYRLHPDPTCRDLDTNEMDLGCQEDLTKLEVRVRLTANGDGSRLAVLIGSERVRPVDVVVSSGKLVVEMFLGPLKEASAIVARVLGEPDDTPDVMKGTLRFALFTSGANKASFTTGITQMVDIQEHGASPSEHFAIRSAISDPLFSLAADGAAGTITGAIEVGMTELFGPWEPEGMPITGAQTHLVLGGLSGSLTYGQATDALTFKGLGLGAGSTYVEVRGQKILQLDVNERDGRRFDLTITAGANDGEGRISVSPRFDLALAWKLAAVAHDYSMPPPAYLMDETYKITLDPTAGKGPTVEAWQDNISLAEGIKVVSGQLSISSSKVSSAIVVPAGKCLVTGTVGPGEHPVLGAVDVIDCP